MRTTVTSTGAALRSSEACDSPLMCLWKMMKKLLVQLSFVFGPSCPPSECNKWLLYQLNSCTFDYCYGITLFCLSYVCNMILAHIWDVFGFPCKIGCDKERLGGGGRNRRWRWIRVRVGRVVGWVITWGDGSCGGPNQFVVCVKMASSRLFFYNCC
jgi:hypothetical protein